MIHEDTHSNSWHSAVCATYLGTDGVCYGHILYSAFCCCCSRLINNISRRWPGVCVAAILFEFRSFCLCIGSTLHCSQNKTKQRRYSASCKHIAEKKTFLFVSHSNFCQQNEHAHFCTFIMSVQHLQWNNFWLQTKFIRYQIGNARMLICPWKNRH